MTRKILALWATPRSTSTAFEWAMANRGDMTCLHEPYNEAYYYGQDRRHDRYFIADPALETTPDLTIAGVHDRLVTLRREGEVFIKDFAYSIMHMADDAFLDCFTHGFLIRDPEKVITSMHARWPDISLDEIGFEDLHTLFRRVADRLGKAPPVIDSDELMTAPEKGMAAYCDAVGIPFLPDALNWEQDQEKNQSRQATWNTDEHGFHDSLKASTGLKAQKRNYPPLSSSADMMRLYEASLPHYQALFEQRVPVA
ncbi:MAG: sulfotransferase family protein [Pseudomonadota bacterium]